jgi:glycosyltransferase involved in cell wall biosynthesis
MRVTRRANAFHVRTRVLVEMNICIITSSFPSRPDDIVQAPFLINFIEGLKKRDHQVFLFTQDREGVKEEFLEGVQVKWFPWRKSTKPLVQLNPMNPLDCLRIGNLFYNGRRMLLPFIKENKIDVCLALWVLPSGYFANHAYRWAGIPYSVWALGSDIYRYGRNPFLYPIMKRVIGEARGVFADGFDLSKRVRERFRRNCFFLATTRTLKKIKSNEPNKPNEPNNPFCFLFVGRLEKVKGLDLLLQSMARLMEEDLDVHLTIVGKGRMEEWAKDFVRQKGLGKRVSMVGNVSDPALASLYTSADCIVIPSRSESIPLIFSEAIRFDKELIVTDVGDMGMLGRQYGVAWVIPPEDPMALKEMMKKRVELKDNGKKVRDEAGREELKRLFDIETSVERFLEDYK